MPEPYDVLVIGTGITGLAAARQSLREGLVTATMESMFFGGLVTNVNDLDGEPGGSGSDVAAGLMMEISKMGAKNISEAATAITQEDDCLAVEGEGGTHRARCVIIASGARLKRLGVPGEAELEEKGVSRCADCDGPFYQGKDVVVVGGGDSALQEALVLAEFAGKVHLVHRGDKFRARRHLVDRLAQHSNIEVHMNTQVEAVLGSDGVSGVKVRTGDKVSEIACAGFFAYVGLEPAVEFVPEEIARDSAGFLLTDASFQTSIPSVFAAGAVRSGYGGMLVHAMAEGEKAAKSALAVLR